MKILLVNANKDRMYTSRQQYRLFDDWTVALNEAKKLGWGQGWCMGGIDERPGMANHQMGGDINLTLMAIEEE